MRIWICGNVIPTGIWNCNGKREFKKPPAFICREEDTLPASAIAVRISRSEPRGSSLGSLSVPIHRDPVILDDEVVLVLAVGIQAHDKHFKFLAESNKIISAGITVIYHFQSAFQNFSYINYG